MCFSSQASFTAAVLIGAIGISTFKYVSNKSEIPIVLIPIFFALQQLTEGFLWVNLGAENPNTALQMGLVYSYLFFGILFWPIWAPFSLYVLEKEPIRKKAILVFLLAGIGMGIVNLYYGMTQQIGVTVVEHSLHYFAKGPNLIFLYGAIVILPCFISSFTTMWHLGVLIVATMLMSYYFFSVTFISVWCFFAAIVSACIFQIFREHASEKLG